MNTGPNTEVGKINVSHNAVKHGIFLSELTEMETETYNKLKKIIRKEEAPTSTLEMIVLDRVALHKTKLLRISKMEKDFIKSILHPKVTVSIFDDNFSEKVVDEGYVPTFNIEAVQSLVDTYSRYETTEENKLFRAINQFLSLKTSRENK